MPADEVLGRDLRTDAVDFSFGEIVNLHNDSEIVISPEYQRLFRWSNEQRSRLIESILVELPIPPIFLIENESGVLELIDGLQRVSSVIQFMSPGAIGLDALKLTGCDLVPALNEKTFNDLSLVDRLRIKRTGIRAIIIRRQGNPHVKYELFKRLNTGGALLSAQEIRNCSSRMVDGGETFYGGIQELASSASFRRAIARLPENYAAQKGDEELVLRFFAVKNYLDGYKGNVKEWLDSYMEGILFGRLPFNYEEESRVFNEVFSIIDEQCGADAFARHKDATAQGRLAPAYFEAAVGGIVRELPAIQGRAEKDLAGRLAAVYESGAFRAVTGPGANTIEKLNGRIELVARALA